MPAHKGHCTNFGLCGKADKKKRLKIREGKRLRCPECGQPLDTSEQLGRFPWRIVTFLMAVFLTATAVEVYRLEPNLDGRSRPGAALDLGRIILWLRDAGRVASGETVSDRPVVSKQMPVPADQEATNRPR